MPESVGNRRRQLKEELEALYEERRAITRRIEAKEKELSGLAG